MIGNVITNATLMRSYRWFRGRTGCVGRDAQASLEYARAELETRSRGWSFEWVDDADGWADLRRDGGVCSCGCGAVIERCEGCILRDEDGNVLESLWAIWDADSDCRRMVEAELALEAI